VTITVAGNVPVFWIGTYVHMVTIGLLIAFLLTSYFQEGSLQIAEIEIT
jgi:hypothetical protein